MTVHAAAEQVEHGEISIDDSLLALMLVHAAIAACGFILLVIATWNASHT